MILALMLAAAEPQSAIDAERAFAAEAQKLGQWTAFRKHAADDAIMFLPQADSAQKFLQGKADPPVAVFWWPGRSYVSCDGKTAINTGPWVRQWGKSVGYFTTVWKQQPDGSWKWLLDHGDGLKSPRAEGGDIKPRLASCKGKPPPLPAGTMVSAVGTAQFGESNDGTLRWSWFVRPDGGRTFDARIWNGKSFEPVISDRVNAQ